MVFRRRAAEPLFPRIEDARKVISRHAGSSAALVVLDDIERSLTTAVDDRERLEQVLTDLDPERATAELKAALRSRSSPEDADTPEITSLRRRHDTINALQNRLDELSRRIERTFVDVETLAAQTAVASLASSDDGGVAEQLRQLTDDAAALEAAHRELADL